MFGSQPDPETTPGLLVRTGVALTEVCAVRMRFVINAHEIRAAIPSNCFERYFSDMSSSVRLSSVVCLSSVTFVRPTQTIEIFGNVFTPFGTLAIHDLCVKILRRSSQGNAFVGG